MQSVRMRYVCDMTYRITAKTNRCKLQTKIYISTITEKQINDKAKMEEISKNKKKRMDTEKRITKEKRKNDSIKK